MRDKADQPPLSHPNRPWALLAVMAVLLVGAGHMAFGQWRSGAIFVGSAALLGALLRALLPRQMAGLLVVRRRWVDVTVLGVLGIAIVVMATQVPPGPYS